MVQLQISLGYGSLGMVFAPAKQDELPALLEQTAQQMGYTVDQVEGKLAAGGTLWLNRAMDRKIRGFDAEAAARVAAERDAQRQRRMAQDGYFSNL